MYQIIQDKHRWESCVAQAGFDTVFCSRDFAQLYCPDPQLFLYQHGQKAALFIFDRMRENVKGLHYGGVVTNCQDDDFCAQVSASLMEYLRRQGVTGLQVRNHPFLATVKVGELLKEEHFIFIDLTRPMDELEASISKQHRRCIRKAGENGLEVSFSDDRGYLKTFYGFYQARQDELGARPQGQGFFERMFGHLGSRLVFGIVRQGSEALAVSVLLKDAGNIFMMYGGMSPAGYEQYAKHLMIFRTMQEFKSKGFLRLVLGTGNGGKDSIYDFKRGFTDKEHCVRTYGIR